MNSRHDNQTKTKIKPARVLYKESYTNSLRSIRVHHTSSQNAFSRLLHANGMDSLHEYLAVTLVHPKTLLFASIISFVGEAISVLMAEVFGYSYNYLLFLYFFLFGYILSVTYLTLTKKLNK